MEIGAVNYVAVLAAAIAAMVVGFIWYNPLFGKKWAKLVGMSEKEIKAGMGKAAPMGFVVMLIGAFVLAHFVTGLAMMDALKVGFMLWLGFMFTKCASTVVWQGTSKELLLIDAGHDLVMMLAMSAVIVLV